MSGCRLWLTQTRYQVRDNHTGLSGGDGNRTHYLFIANEALCQMSYTPKGVPV